MSATRKKNFYAVARQPKEAARDELIAWMHQHHPTQRNPGSVFHFYVDLLSSAYPRGDGQPRRHPDGHAGRIAEEFGLQASTAGSYLGLLEQIGWIEWQRTPNQEADGHVKLLRDLEEHFGSEVASQGGSGVASEPVEEISREAPRGNDDTKTKTKDQDPPPTPSNEHLPSEQIEVVEEGEEIRRTLPTMTNGELVTFTLSAAAEGSEGLVDALMEVASREADKLEVARPGAGIRKRITAALGNSPPATWPELLKIALGPTGSAIAWTPRPRANRDFRMPLAERTVTEQEHETHEAEIDYDNAEEPF